ncbi:hypothetical protein Acr_12g0002800 [Actinidia rufa]|uniref:Uncharacterized protein n=1 Tax=Actinidia rufa TaxID=165716 RepID=A0A7J0FHT7_9ERIC|nr:hypothetical protein Acr_12g0002800 [Actinidia rufa]
MVIDLAISLISSLPSPLLHGLATIFLFPIFPSIGLQIHPRLEMGRTGVPSSVVTRPPRDGENTVLPSCWGKKNAVQDGLSLWLNNQIGEEEQGRNNFIWFGVICENNSSQLFMHLHSHLLPQPSANSPLDNRAPDLEGLHCEMHGIVEQIRIMNENNTRLIKHLTTNNPPPLAVPPIPKEVDQSRRSHRFRDHESQSCHSTSQAQSSRNWQRRSPSLRSRRERSSIRSESRSSSRTHDTEGEKTMRRGRSPRRND